MFNYYSIFLLIVLNVTFMTTSSNKMSELDAKIIRTMNLQEIIINLFSLLTLNTNLTNTYETRLLLSMFASLKKISIENFQTYSNVTNTARLNLEIRKFENTSLFKLDKPVQEIIAEDFNLKNYTNGNVTGKQNCSNSMVSDDSKETIKIISEYLADVKNLLEDKENPSRKIKDLYDRHISARRRNDAWEPSNSTELLGMKNRKMLNSKQVQIKKFPFVVSIHVKNLFVCTGAIISNNMIITSASCLHETYFDTTYLQKNPHSVTVRVGSEYPDKFGEVIEAANFYICPDFEFETLRNNIAILEIKKYMQLKGKNSKTRRINYHSGKYKLGQEVMMLGWGSRITPSLNFKYQIEQLSYSMLNLMANIEECMEIYTKKFVTTRNFCATDLIPNTGACQHDFGGPAVMGNKLVGLVSFAPPVCGTLEAPTVFTNITFYMEWLDRIVSKKKPQVYKAPNRFQIRPRPVALRREKPIALRKVELTRSPRVNKLFSKVSTKAKDKPIARQSYNYDDVDDFITEPNSHLWVTTQLDVHHHPLYNQSLFLLDYQDSLETESTKGTTTVSHKPLDEVLLDYYIDKNEGNNDTARISPILNKIIQKNKLTMSTLSHLRQHALVSYPLNAKLQNKTKLPLLNKNLLRLWKHSWTKPHLGMLLSVTPYYAKTSRSQMRKIFKSGLISRDEKIPMNPNEFLIQNFAKSKIFRTPKVKHLSTKMNIHHSTQRTATIKPHLNKNHEIRLRTSDKDFESVDFPDGMQSFKSDEYILILRNKPTTKSKYYKDLNVRDKETIPQQPPKGINIIPYRHPTRFEIIGGKNKKMPFRSKEDDTRNTSRKTQYDTSQTTIKTTTDSSPSKLKEMLFNISAGLTHKEQGTNEKYFQLRSVNKTESQKERKLQKILVLLLEREIDRADKTTQNSQPIPINTVEESDEDGLKQINNNSISKQSFSEYSGTIKSTIRYTKIAKQEPAPKTIEKYGDHIKQEDENTTNDYDNSEQSLTDDDILEDSSNNQTLNSMSTNFRVTKQEPVEVVAEKFSEESDQDDDAYTIDKDDNNKKDNLSLNQNTLLTDNNPTTQDALKKDRGENQHPSSTAKVNILTKLVEIVNNNDSDVEYSNTPKILRVSEKNVSSLYNLKKDNRKIINYNNTFGTANNTFIYQGDSYEIENVENDENRRSGRNLNNRDIPSFLDYIDL